MGDVTYIVTGPGWSRFLHAIAERTTVLEAHDRFVDGLPEDVARDLGQWDLRFVQYLSVEIGVFFDRCGRPGDQHAIIFILRSGQGIEYRDLLCYLESQVVLVGGQIHGRARSFADLYEISSSFAARLGVQPIGKRALHLESEINHRWWVHIGEKSASKSYVAVLPKGVLSRMLSQPHHSRPFEVYAAECGETPLLRWNAGIRSEPEPE